MRTQVLLALVAALAVGGCGRAGSAKPLPVSYQDGGKTYEVGDLVEGRNAFAFDLSHEMLKGPEGNRVASPLSVAICLSMLANGLQGQTLAEVDALLADDGVPKEIRNSFSRDLIAQLERGDPKVQMHVANAVFFQKDRELVPAFGDSLKEFYKAEAQGVDLQGDPTGSLKTINGWVNRATEGRIPTILDRLESQSVMVLVNAINFTGGWKLEFETAATYEAEFTMDSGEERAVQMMNQTEDFEWARMDSGENVLRMAFGKGDYAMLFVLPKEGTKLADAVAEWDSSDLKAWREALFETEVIVSLPKFKIEDQMDLVPVLEALGAPSLLAASGDQSYVTPADVQSISQAVHKAMVEVDEKGAKAAAVTAMEAKTEEEGAEWNGNRPFWFAIEHRPSGALVFVGWYAVP